MRRNDRGGYVRLQDIADRHQLTLRKNGGDLKTPVLPRMKFVRPCKSEQLLDAPKFVRSAIMLPRINTAGDAPHARNFR